MTKKIATLAALALLAGCGVSRTDARDAATDRTCDYYDRCGRIGAGESYPDRDSCEVQWRSNWNNFWPDETCSDRIDPDSLDLCLKTIQSQSCSDTFDILDTYDKCKPELVCSGK